MKRKRQQILKEESVHVADGEKASASASELFPDIYHVLDSVRMEPSLGDPLGRERYNYLLSIVNPSAEVGDQKALHTLFMQLARAASRIDATYHSSLLNNLFGMCIWFFEVSTRLALLKLITILSTVSDKYWERCLHMLVSNFVPPENVLMELDEPKWISRKREIQEELCIYFRYIYHSSPDAQLKLLKVLDKTIQYDSDSAKLNAYVECMLVLQREEIEEAPRSTLLSKVINLLLDLDINMAWNDMLQEDETLGSFDTEFENLSNPCLQVPEDGVKTGASFYGRDLTSNNNGAFMEKFDSLMAVICKHLDSCVKNGCLSMDYTMFMDIFRASVLKRQPKFTQFVMFYACSLDPVLWGAYFALDLAEIFLSTSEDLILRRNAILYLASYLARAKFISLSIVARILKGLVNWCSDYCKIIQEEVYNPIQKALNLRSHEFYYSACQAVMYILCFRMRELMDLTEPAARSFLFDLPLSSILFNDIQPLKVCFPPIVQEFIRQSKAAGLIHASVDSVDENAFKSEFVKAFGGTLPMHYYFPFRPYLLKESVRFMRPNYVYWSEVNTKNNNKDSEEEKESRQ